MVELGRIEKPEAESFTGKRKLYCVSNIYPLEDASDEYKDLCNRYWDEVTQQIEKLEAIGKIKKIFYENIYIQGEEALNLLEKMNEKAHQIIKRKIEEGAMLLPIEDEDMLGRFIDWSNCLRIVRKKEVFDKILEFYTEIINQRIQHILKAIDSNLSENEAGLFIIRDEDRIKIQFPKDIEVFLVTPPSYDNILKWLREKWKEIYKEKTKEETGEEEKKSEPS